MEMYTPFEPVPFTDRICSVHDGSIWDFNRHNSCKHFQPKTKLSLWQKFIRIFK